MDWLVLVAAGLLYGLMLLLLTTESGRLVLDRLSGFGHRSTPTIVKPGDVLYDGQRYYRAVEVESGVITLHFVLSVGEMSRIGFDRINDGTLQLKGHHFDVVAQGAEALELQGELPKEVVQTGMQPRHEVRAPFAQEAS